MKSYTNSRITYLIDEHIHSKRDREIMKLHYVDGKKASTVWPVMDELMEVLRVTNKPLYNATIRKIQD